MTLGAMGADHLAMLGEPNGCEAVAVGNLDPARREPARPGRPDCARTAISYAAGRPMA